MKNYLLKSGKTIRQLIKPAILICVFYNFSINSYAQTLSSFENLVLQTDTFWNGSDLTGGFTSGNAYFTNRYDTTYGDSWSGFVYSNMTDDSTSGFTNQYSAITAKGHNNSDNYGLFYYSSYSQKSFLKLNIADTILGFYVTNSTWAAFSMLNGDVFSKKFGGISGNDTDWFKLSITGYYNGLPLNDTVDFYLADYRFTINSQDYIVNTWNWVNLTSLGKVDSLEFLLSSTDNGTYGMNTPAYFCIDNFTTKSATSGITNVFSTKNDITIYPNPAIDNINIEFNENYSAKCFIEISDINNKVMYSNYNDSKSTININNYANGLYFVKVIKDKTELKSKFIKL